MTLTISQHLNMQPARKKVPETSHFICFPKEWVRLAASFSSISVH